MFKLKKVALITCISILTCSSLVFAAEKLNNVLYNKKGEKIFEVSSDKKIHEQYPDALDSNKLRNDLTAKFSSETAFANSEVKNGEMLIMLYKDKDRNVLDSKIISETKDNVAYKYDSKFARFYSYDDFKKAFGDWAKYPKYLPNDSKFSYAMIRYTLDPKLISQLRKEMLIELEPKPEGFAYRIIKIPEKSIIRTMNISFTAESCGNFSLCISQQLPGIMTANDEAISKLTLENGKEAILDSNSSTVFYADESQIKESSQVVIASLNSASSDDLNIIKTPVVYSINKLSKSSLDEAKKILESIQ